MNRRIALVLLGLLLVACSSKAKPTKVDAAGARPKLPTAFSGPTVQSGAAAPFGATTYVVEGQLPELAATAPAFRLGDERDVAALAKALGVSPGDVTVDQAPGGPWRLGQSTGSGVAYACSSDQPVCPAPPRPEGLPTRDEGERLARQTLSRSGVDLATAKVAFSDDFSQWRVTADPVVGGLPTVGYSWSAAAGPNGAVSANGWLGHPKRLADYDLVGTASGVARLQAGVNAGPQPMIATPACGPDGRCPPAPKPAVVTGVHLALMLVANEGGAYLEPAYVFELKGGGETRPIPAVVDQELFTPPMAETQTVK